jgi:hypothetical protein
MKDKIVPVITFVSRTIKEKVRCEGGDYTYRFDPKKDGVNITEEGNNTIYVPNGLLKHIVQRIDEEKARK